MCYTSMHLYLFISFQKEQFSPSLTNHEFDPEYRFFNCKNHNNNFSRLYHICNLCKITKEKYGLYKMIDKTLILIADISSIFSCTSFTCFHHHLLTTVTNIS